MSVLVCVCVCVCECSVAELMIYADSQQTLVLAGVGMDGAAPSAPTFARFAKGVSAAIMVKRLEGIEGGATPQKSF